MELYDTRETIKSKLRQNFDGKIVRKDLTKKIKEGANVPNVIKLRKCKRVARIEKILATNFMNIM